VVRARDQKSGRCVHQSQLIQRLGEVTSHTFDNFWPLCFSCTYIHVVPSTVPDIAGVQQMSVEWMNECPHPGKERLSLMGP
jgi:hypothetical protein